MRSQLEPDELLVIRRIQGSAQTLGGCDVTIKNAERHKIPTIGHQIASKLPVTSSTIPASGAAAAATNMFAVSETDRIAPICRLPK